MRDTKTLLEILLSSFLNNFKGLGLCCQIYYLVDSNEISYHKKKELDKIVERYTLGAYMFGECLSKYKSTEDYYESFYRNHHKRVEFLQNRINELN